MRIEKLDDEIVIWGSMVGTTLSTDDQKFLIKWFMHNKPEMVKESRKDLRTLKSLKKSLKESMKAGEAP